MRLPPFHLRFTSSVVLLAYLNLVVPLPAVLAANAPAEPKDDPLVRTPAHVKVNRVSAKDVPPPARPQFSREPSVQEIFSARVLAEPFVPVGVHPPAAETAALAAAITRYASAGAGDVAPFTAFLTKYPDSAWAPSVRLNLGLLWYSSANFSKAMAAYEAAWNQAKSVTEPRGKELGDRAIAELLRMNARLGRVDTLRKLFAEVEGRQFTGTATELVEGARQGLGLMLTHPEAAYRCGPAALDRIVARQKNTVGFESLLTEAKSTEQGIALTEVWQLAQKAGLKLQMARRAPGATILSPAVIHWKLGHYAALFSEGATVRLEDPTFGPQHLRATAATIDDEASGYFLVSAGALPAGWSAVSEQEGRTIFGKGNTSGADNSRTSGSDQKTSGGGGPGWNSGGGSCPGMAGADAHLMAVSLNLMDTPVGYAPPIGPAVYFTATYNQREASQPTTIDYFNLGSKWVNNWLSFIDEGAVPASGPATLTAAVCLPGGGSESFTSAPVDPTTYPYDFLPQPKSRVHLQKTGATAFVVVQPDGSQMTFARRTGVAGAYRYFLTKVANPTGQAVTLAYDAQNRLATITDALGQVTTFSYELAADPLKITKVTDPFGRFASFDYDASGRLQKITDVLGLQSQFGYSGTGDFIASLTTPYGTTTFAFGVGANGIDRWLELTDPLGDKRRVEYRNDWGSLVPGPGQLPAGMTTTSNNTSNRNTLYWDKKAMKDSNGDPSAAHIYHWLHTALNTTSGTLESEKDVFENRVFYNYEGQSQPQFEGTSSLPTVVGRIMDDGTTQLSKTEYNSYGRVTKSTDPRGRVTSYLYDAAGLDLLEIRQQTGPNAGDYEVLGKTTYNSNHQPLTMTDASGQVTTLAYNSAGQVSTVTNAKSEVTRFYYDPAGDPAGSRLANGDRDSAATGYLVTIDGPLSGAADTATVAYDGFGRPRTVTDTEGYAVTTDYDAFDRPTVATFPDATFNQIVYDKLDAVKTRDRRGRVSQLRYNARRQLMTATDPLGRLTQFDWCKCGGLKLLIDAAGNRTTWTHDTQGRVTSKQYADGKSVVYAYENATSRLKSVTDAKGQVTNYQYFPDSALKQVSYTSAAVATPTVSFTYEANYARVATMTDSTGTTAYTYNPIPQTNPGLGAGRLASIDGPLANDTIACTYDELGRVLTRSINGTANTSSVAYDALGRVTSATNPLGTFGYAYVNATGRLDRVDYPNGQRTNYSYYNNAGDHRLQQIQNLKQPDGPNLSTFGHTYDADGLIQSWSKQLDNAATPQVATFKYDAADQLIEATMPSASSVSKNYVYRYDRAGNRISEQIDNAVTAATHNNLNQATSLSASGSIRFEGTVSEPANVTINGQPATVDANNAFKVDVPLAPGTSTAAVAATDGSGNTATKNYQVTVASGTARSLTYDANGNLANDGAGKTYDWDAVNRLVKITQGGSVTEFVYDGYGRRVKEKLNGAVIKQWVWCDGPQPCEERDGSNAVTKRFYGGLGEQIGGTAYFFTNDHLGSVREMTDVSGAIRARYDYDPYGRTTKISGDLEADFGFTGFYRHQSSGLSLTLYRQYDATLGLWLSRDPISESGGENLYGYVGNRPINAIDPLGLLAIPPPVPAVANPVGAVIALGAATVILVAIDIKILADALRAQKIAREAEENAQRLARRNPKPKEYPDGTCPGSPYPPGSPDPYPMTRVNPGTDPSTGKCKPCPKNSPAWEVLEPGHGGKQSHWHWIVYDQNPSTCECVPRRLSSPTKPPGA